MLFPAVSVALIVNATVPFVSQVSTVCVAVQLCEPPDTVAALPAMETVGVHIFSVVVNDSVMIFDSFATVDIALLDVMLTDVATGATVSTIKGETGKVI